MTPIWKIDFDGRDITDRLSPFLISMTLSDVRGRSGDDLSLTLDDTGGLIPLPAPGRKIKFWLGTKETGLYFKGVFIVDELESIGPPDKVTLKANSADFTENLKVRREASFHDTTMGDIVNEISARHNLSKSIGETLAGRTFAHITQTNESDLNLLTRLAKDIGGFFAVKNETLILSPEAISETNTGQTIPSFALARTETSDFHFSEKSREHKFTGAKAAWNDIENSTKRWEIAGTDDKVKALPGVFPNADYARKAADAEYARLQRGELSFSAQLSQGEPSLTPETPVKASGFKPIINQTDWVMTSVRHTLGGQGLLSEIEMENAKTKSGQSGDNSQPVS